MDYFNTYMAIYDIIITNTSKKLPNLLLNLQ